MSYIPESALPDKSTFTEGTTQLTPVGGEYNDSATSPSSGQAAVARITPNRAIHANLRNQAGSEVGTSGNPVRVDPTGTTTQPVSGSVSISGTPNVSVSNTPSVAQSGTWSVQLAATSSGGWSVSPQNSLSNTAAVLKSSAGQFGGYMLFNPNTSTVYIQVFNSAAPTVGTTAPAFVIPLPAGAGANLEIALGVAMPTAIAVAATTTATGGTGPTTALTGFFLYK